MVQLAMQKSETKKDQFQKAFEAFRKKEFTKEPAWLSSVRDGAIRYFSEHGFPTPHEEQWRYTNLGVLRDTHFDFSLKSDARISPETINRLRPFQIDSYRLVFIDGFFSESLSSVKSLPAGVTATGLRSALNTHVPKIEPHLTRWAGFEHNPFAALNTALFRDGAFVYFEEGAVLEKPLELVFISASSGKIISHPRNLIISGRKSRASVIESYISLSKDAYFTNAVTEIILEEGASLNHLKFQREGASAFHIGTTRTHQEKNSVFSSASVDFGGKLVRHNLSVSLDGEGAETRLFGLYLTEGEQHVDHNTFISHPSPHGQSRQVYKGILDGKSTAIFSGKIFVHKDAQKTDAAQTNKNLLLSDEATVDTKPHLEIFADDVKCTHGAAVGQLDEAAVFYFKSRGLDEQTARSVLCFGFANEVIENVPIESVRAPLAALVLERLEKRNQ